MFVVIIPRPALCDRSLVDSIKDRDAGIRNALEEVDPMLTDPRGRRIGFDPPTRRAWQQLPEAEGRGHQELSSLRAEIPQTVVCRCRAITSSLRVPLTGGRSTIPGV